MSQQNNQPKKQSMTTDNSRPASVSVMEAFPETTRAWSLDWGKVKDEHPRPVRK